MASSLRRTPKPGIAFTFIECLARPLLAVLCKRDWRGRQNVPQQGGVIVVANHYSFFDPISIGHYIVCNGRTPRFLAKAGVFKQPVLGKLFRAAGQIPVYRDSREAAQALRDAEAAVKRGEVLIFYPEGTMTKDPDLWPMVGKTGAARLALRTGAPVLPIAQWGAQEVFARYSKKPQFFPRKTLKVTAGPVINLTERFGTRVTTEAMHAATELIMDTITGMLAEIRGEEPPAVRYDPDAVKREQDAPEVAAAAEAKTGELESSSAESTLPESALAESASAEPVPSESAAVESVFSDSAVSDSAVSGSADSGSADSDSPDSGSAVSDSADSGSADSGSAHSDLAQRAPQEGMGAQA